ncbi:MAG: hypothetical protein EXR95_07025 [Gemmatimonadetes bacterium]|nr:hypothetical protein [Gemmatimonadota bacterium]
MPRFLIRDNQLVVIVELMTASPITSATASIGGVSKPLTNSGVNLWTATLQLASVPSGNHDLAITANGATLTRPVLLDRPAEVSVVRPVEGDTARPSIRITASCTDDIRCVRIYVSAAPSGVTNVNSTTLVDVNAAAVDTTVALTRYIGQTVDLTFLAIDACCTGEASIVRRRVVVRDK